MTSGLARPTAADRELDDATAALRGVVRAVVAAVLRAPREHPDVEDCTHEALRRALEGRSRLREGEALRPWVIGIARHVALDHRRAKHRDRTSLSDDGESAELAVDRAPYPDEQAESAQAVERLLRVMETLPTGPREALVLFHGEGLGYVAIAARLGVPLGTVATWIARGRRTVADAMEPATTRPS